MLKELQAEHGGEFQKLRFVEDKLSTLEKVVDEAALEDWELYFVDWGFNTAGETRRRRRTRSRRTAGTDARAALQRSGPRPPRTRASSSSTSRGSRRAGRTATSVDFMSRRLIWPSRKSSSE